MWILKYILHFMSIWVFGPFEDEGAVDWESGYDILPRGYEACRVVFSLMTSLLSD